MKHLKILAILFAAAAMTATCSTANASKGGSSSKSESRSESRSRSESGGSRSESRNESRGGGSYSPAPAPAPSPSASPAPASATAAAPAPSTSTSTSSSSTSTGSSWVAGGPTTGHPLTWRIGIAPTKPAPEGELQFDPPAAGPRVALCSNGQPEPCPDRLVEVPLFVPLPGPERVEKTIVQTAAVFFDTGKATLTREGAAALKLLAKRAKDTKEAEVGLAAGFADVTGRPDANRVLSERRADTVRAFLVSAGLPPEAIRTEAHGDTAPVGAGDLQLDRRVDVVLRGAIE